MIRILVSFAGIEITNWRPHATRFIVRSTGGATFEEVDLSEGDWADYDADNDLSVSITNLEQRFDVRR